MNVLLLIIYFRVQNHSILSQKIYYYYMFLNVFCCEGSGSGSGGRVRAEVENQNFGWD